MLTICGAKHRFCDGLDRREFLRVGAIGGGLTLANALRARTLAGPTGAPIASLPSKSAIMIFLLGGASQLDTYDLKPEAPLEYRGEFKPIKTSVSGIEICELFPKQAALMDKLAILRSIVSNEPGHGDNELVSGYNQIENRTAHHPSIGAVVSKLRGASRKDVPPFVSLRRMTFPTPLPEFEYDLEPGFLGPTHRPFMPDGPGLVDLAPPSSIDLRRLEDRRGLLAGFDRLRRELDTSGTMEAMDAFGQRAFDIVSSSALADALDLSREDPRLLDRYGRGSQLLLARRLIEAGVGFVSVAMGYWDTHVDNFNQMRQQLCPQFDQAFSALVEDLCQRGLDQEVLVVAWGEFGRTPRINKNAGRDHWVPVMSAVFAGGGLKMGHVIGSSDRLAENPKDRPYRVSQVLSTIHRALGIDPSITLRTPSGRPVYLLDDREPVRELL